MVIHKSGILFVGGNAPEPKWYQYLEDRFDIKVAADAGFDLAASLGVRPDTVVGDMDSIQSIEALATYDGADVIKYSEDKDETDTEIGLKLLWDSGCNFVCIYGGGGGRLDHLVGLLAIFDRDLFPNLWILDTHLITTISDRITIVGKKGSVVSFFPVGTEPCTMTSSGLKWGLDNLRWSKGDCGISNVISENAMWVQIKTGRLIMVGELNMIDGVVP